MKWGWLVWCGLSAPGCGGDARIPDSARWGDRHSQLEYAAASAIDGDLLLVAGDNGLGHAERFDAESGDLVWSLDVGAHFDFPVIGSGDDGNTLIASRAADGGWDVRSITSDGSLAALQHWTQHGQLGIANGVMAARADGGLVARRFGADADAWSGQLPGEGRVIVSDDGDAVATYSVKRNEQECSIGHRVCKCTVGCVMHCYAGEGTCEFVPHPYEEWLARYSPDGVQAWSKLVVATPSPNAYWDQTLFSFAPDGALGIARTVNESIVVDMMDPDGNLLSETPINLSSFGLLSSFTMTPSGDVLVGIGWETTTGDTQPSRDLGPNRGYVVRAPLGGTGEVSELYDSVVAVAAGKHTYAMLPVDVLALDDL